MNHSGTVSSLCRRQILVVMQREVVGAKTVAQSIFPRRDFLGFAEFDKRRVVGVAALCPQRAFMLAIGFKPCGQCRADFNQAAAARLGFRGGNGDMSRRAENILPRQTLGFLQSNPGQTLQRDNRAHGVVCRFQHGRNSAGRKKSVSPLSAFCRFMPDASIKRWFAGK